MLFKFTINIDGLDEDTFVVRDFEGHESLSHQASFFSDCHGFHYDIGLASRRSDLSAFDVVDQFAELHIIQKGEFVQRVHGVVSGFTLGDTGHNYTFYRLVLVPSMMRLSLHHDRRIFQKQSVPEIIATRLQEVGIQDYAFALIRDIPLREFCMQYRETNLAFIERLAAEEGLSYHHEHMAGKHTVIFSDASIMMPMLSKSITYHNNGGGVAPSTFISTFEKHTQRGVTKVELEDRSFQKPNYRFTQSAHGRKLDYQRDDYAHFDFPGRYKDDQQGKALSQIRLEYLRREQHTVSGQSNEPLLRAGYRFSLTGHMNESNNRDWMVVNVHHQGRQPQVLEEEGGSGATTYHNTFKLIPADSTWRATPTLKPLAHGPEIALVVGPEGEEIHCDQYGRVRIQFPWDRYSTNDGSTSCWIRVAQGLAGSQYGSMALPRVGDEVVVSFLHGDPDQPMVTARTYNETNVPPYPLPEHKTKTVLRSKTHQGQGFNELSFEDQAGQEKLYLHAQKDMETDVLNDQVITIKHDQHTTIDNTRFTHIKQDEHHTVGGHYHQQIEQDHSLSVSGSMHHKANGRYAMEVKEEVHLKAGQKVVIEAGSELTLKVGGSFIKIDASGVSLVGTGINLNAGGSAGSGKGVAGQLPSLPLGIESPAIPDEVFSTKISPIIFETLASLNIPIARVANSENTFFESTIKEDAENKTLKKHISQKRKFRLNPINLIKPALGEKLIYKYDDFETVIFRDFKIYRKNSSKNSTIVLLGHGSANENSGFSSFVSLDKIRIPISFLCPHGYIAATRNPSDMLVNIDNHIFCRVEKGGGYHFPNDKVNYSFRTKEYALGTEDGPKMSDYIFTKHEQDKFVNILKLFSSSDVNMDLLIPRSGVKLTLSSLLEAPPLERYNSLIVTACRMLPEHASAKNIDWLTDTQSLVPPKD